MGLDIYAGTLTRYYLDDWKTVVEQWAQENGYGFEIVDDEGNKIDKNHDMSKENVENTNKLIKSWQEELGKALEKGVKKFTLWNEGLTKPYFTDKPDWIAYGALILRMAGKLFNEEVPEFLEKSWRFEKDKLVQRALVDSSTPNSLMTLTTWWLPINDRISMRFKAPTGQNIICATTDLLFDELKYINSKLWNASEKDILRWDSEEGYPVDFSMKDGGLKKFEDNEQYNTDSLAKFAFSLMWKAVKFSLENQVPILLDSYEEMIEVRNAVLYDLEDLAIEYLDNDENKQALKTLKGIEKYLSDTEATFYHQSTYYLFGITYKLLDEEDKALEYAQKSIEIERILGDAYTLKGVIYKLQERYHESAEAYKKAILSQYYNGSNVFYNQKVENVWHYMAISMLYAYEQNKKYPITNIMKVLLETIIITPDYFNAYHNMSSCFGELKSGGLLSMFGKEQKIINKLNRIVKTQNVSEKEHKKLVREIANYARDDDYPNFHYRIYVNKDFAKDINPTFINVKNLLKDLWDEKDITNIILEDAFGEKEHSLSISLKKELVSKKKYIEFNLRVKSQDENAFKGKQDYFFKKSYDLTDAIHNLEEYFVFYQILGTSSWLTSEVYDNELVELVKQKVIIPFEEKTRVEYNNIYLTKEDCSNIQSKVGGNPYMPIDYPWPKSPLGTPLRFLAQINFEQMPSIPDFPKKGILQFFILEDDVIEKEYIYGLDEGGATTEQKGFRLVYHSEIDDKTAQQEPPEDCFEERDALLKRDDCLKINFEKSTMAMTPDDFRFDEKFLPLFNKEFNENITRIWDMERRVVNPIYDELFKGGHRVGGYPYFCQEDPRIWNNNENKDVLLFQLDSDDVEDISIMWGDAGVANFFISKEDLRNCNFTDVLYTWDCG